LNFRLPIALLASASLAFGAAACGGGDDEGTGAGAEQQQEQQQQAEPVAQIDTVTGRNTEVTLDAGFVEALTTLGVTPAPVGDGEITDQGVARFPITGGNVTYYEPGTVSPFVQGRLDHDGSGLSLTAGDTEVELTDFVVDPGASVLTGNVSVNGEEAASGAPLFFLDGRTLNPLEVNENQGTAVLEGTTVKLKAEAAQLLNDTFGIQDLQEGMEIGIAKITLELPES